MATPTAAATTYTVNVTNATTGCMKTDAVVVTVNAKPMANAGVDKNLTNCTAVTIGAAAVTGVSYSWTPTTGLSSTIISNLYGFSCGHGGKCDSYLYGYGF